VEEMGNFCHSTAEKRSRVSNEHERIENLCRIDLARFPAWMGASSGAKSGVLTTRIYNYPAQQSSPGAVSPVNTHVTECHA
jgi:hypothetical protein